MLLHIYCFCSDNKDNVEEANIQHRQNKFVPTSESVTACSIHPLNGTIVAGTKVSFLYT